MKIAVFAIVVVALMVGLFFFLRPKENSSSAKNLTIDLTLKDNQITSKNKTFTVTEGEKVTFRFISDRDEELHIHGYDITIPLKKNARSTATFTASQTGGFPIELHGAEKEVALLEVTPR